jgi:hypothetical protein
LVRLEDFTDEELALVATAELPTEDGHLDDELRDWLP